MDTLQLTGRKLVRVFNFRNDSEDAVNFICHGEKQPNFKLKTWPKQPLGSLPLDIALPHRGRSSQCDQKILKKITQFLEIVAKTVTTPKILKISVSEAKKLIKSCS